VTVALVTAGAVLLPVIVVGPVAVKGKSANVLVPPTIIFTKVRVAGGVLPTVAVQVPEGIPPLIPAHVHDTELPEAGNAGVKLGVPAEQRVSAPKLVAV
jgi:hypothetical protein